MTLASEGSQRGLGLRDVTLWGMDFEQPCGLGGCLISAADHPCDLGLLRRRELWAASADAGLGSHAARVSISRRCDEL